MKNLHFVINSDLNMMSVMLMTGVSDILKENKYLEAFTYLKVEHHLISCNLMVL